MTRIAFIENRGPNSVKATLKKLFDGASAADVQVAFTTKSGLDALLPRLSKVATKGKVRFLTGLYQGNTEPDALRVLQRAQLRSGNRLEVRLAKETRFHRKAYLARTKSTLHAVIGSSNLTTNGLGSGGELNVLLSFPVESKQAKAAMETFERAWSDGAALTARRVKRYAEVRVRPVAPLIPQATIASIIGRDAKHKRSDDVEPSAITKPRSWVNGITGTVGKQTMAVVADETDWDRNGWNWCSTHTSVFARGDRLLVLDRSSKPGWARLARVLDVQRTATPTPDGRDFMAYAQLAKTHRRRLTRKLLRLFHKAGVKTSANRAKMSAKVWDAVVKLM
ncbi:MAG TPA: phospholipase D-like domain-containing protein [Kofleriaceae bacterium]|nr:phospholipase D-like domain-containing protein [Kofleriaceae bacterium]